MDGRQIFFFPSDREQTNGQGIKLAAGNQPAGCTYGCAWARSGQREGEISESSSPLVVPLLTDPWAPPKPYIGQHSTSTGPERERERGGRTQINQGQREAGLGTRNLGRTKRIISWRAGNQGGHGTAHLVQGHPFLPLPLQQKNSLEQRERERFPKYEIGCNGLFFLPAKIFLHLCYNIYTTLKSRQHCSSIDVLLTAVRKSTCIIIICNQSWVRGGKEACIWLSSLLTYLMWLGEYVQ